MNHESELQLAGMEHARPFMTSAQYQAFTEKFREAVTPVLEELREARMHSEEEAKRHFVR